MLRMTLAAASLAALTGLAFAMAPGEPAAVENDGGKYYDAEGAPTFNMAADGTVDFYTFSGFRRYHAECHVCHGPDGLGSSYAPNLVESLGRIGYDEFLNVVVNGKQESTGGAQSVMPSFGTNPNVMCYLDDIYVYLRARSQGELARGRPAKREDKSAEFSEAEDACMGAT